MTLDLVFVAILSLAALLYAALVPRNGRGWALLAGSVIAIYWLQPSLPIRFSSYALQTATVVLTVLTWWLTRHPDPQARAATAGEDRRAVAVIAGLVLLMALNRYLPFEARLTADRPPSPLLVAAVLGALGLLMLLIGRARFNWGDHRVLGGAIAIIVAVFVVLKWEPVAAGFAGQWRTWTGQDAGLASFTDLAWLGFSYVAFRLIHALRDRQTGTLPALSLREFTTYVLFAPAYIAGPIDRAERFVTDLRALPALTGLDGARFAAGGSRIVVGLAKKFIVADGLAQGMALTPLNAVQATSSAGLWVLLYGYALRLYFDFAGYTDIAIGLGMLFGVTLPENFDRPYWRTNITRFWQSWHITLSDWVRFYVFSPLSRSLLRREPRPSSTVIVLVSQLATMIVIGLWHGISWPFLIWGIWHGLGLFAHKQWSDRTRKWYRGLKEKPWQLRSWTAVSWFLTFNFVALGWVWFLMPDVQLAVQTLGRLFGVGW